MRPVRIRIPVVGRIRSRDLHDDGCWTDAAACAGVSAGCAAAGCGAGVTAWLGALGDHCRRRVARRFLGRIDLAGLCSRKSPVADRRAGPVFARPAAPPFLPAPIDRRSALCPWRYRPAAHWARCGAGPSNRPSSFGCYRPGSAFALPVSARYRCRAARQRPFSALYAASSSIVTLTPKDYKVATSHIFARRIGVDHRRTETGLPSACSSGERAGAFVTGVGCGVSLPLPSRPAGLMNRCRRRWRQATGCPDWEFAGVCRACQRCLSGSV